MENFNIAQLPSIASLQSKRELQNKENKPTITYKLTNTIRNKVLGHKDTVNLINAEGEISFTLNCELSILLIIDPPHKHIITGDLILVGRL